MTKIAVLMNGVIRLPIDTHVACVENIRKQIEATGKAKATIYYYTWSNASDDSPHKEYVSLDNWGNVDELAWFVDHFQAEINSPTDEFLTSIDFPHAESAMKLDPDGKHGFYVVRQGAYSMHFQTKKQCDTVNDSGKRFDYYMRIRNDLMTEFNIDTWLDVLKSDINVYGVPPNFWSNGHGLNDHIGIATPELFNKIWNYTEIQNLYPALRLWNHESAVQKCVLDAGGIPKILPVNSYVIKRTPGFRKGDWTMVNGQMVSFEQ